MKTRLWLPGALLVLVALSAALALPGKAFAEGDGNAVNTQQLPDSSFLYDTSIVDLSTADSYYDLQTVQVVGEVVGDNLRADVNGEYRWICLQALNSDSNATLMAYMTEEQAAKIESYGKYGTTGTHLQVHGVFHLVCSEHEGETDLHAESVSVVDQGSRHADSFDILSFLPGAIIVVVGLCLLRLFYHVRERRR